MATKTWIVSALVLGFAFTVSSAKADDQNSTVPGLPNWPTVPGLPGAGDGSGNGGLPGWPGTGDNNGGLPGWPSTGSGTGDSAPAGAPLGQTITGSFSDSAGSRGYSAFIPNNLPAHAGLMVVLHGCTMTDTQMAAGTHMDVFAAQRGFVVLYPIQTSADNMMSCWNFFDQSNQQRVDSEGAIIVGMVQQLVSKYNLDSSHIAITGISAGGAQASNMLGCYSDIFQGGLIQSGLVFGAAQDMSAGELATSQGTANDLDQLAQTAYTCAPKRTKLMPVVVVQGTADYTVNKINADQIATFFTKLNTLYATGGGNTPVVTQATKQLDAQTQGGYTSNETDSVFTGQVVVQKILVNGMGHAWSGGDASVQYMDPKGPSSTEMVVNLFFPGQGQ